MPKFNVQVYKTWKEFGEVEVDADSEDQAQDVARELLADGDEGITWNSDNMDPQDEGIEQVTPIE